MSFGTKRADDSRPWLIAGLSQGAKVLLAAFFLFVAVMAVFFPAIKNEFASYDDQPYVTENLEVQKGLTWSNVGYPFQSTAAANWHPLTWFSHMVDCQLYGLKPWGHHLTSILLHALNTTLLFFFFTRVGGGTIAGSFIAAALFGMHPLRVESVAWVAERKDVLSLFFGLLCLSAYLRYGQASAANTKHKFVLTRWYWAALVLFALGLMSKPMLVTVPGIMLLLDFWPLQRLKRGRLRSCVVEKIPFFALAAASSLITFVIQKNSGAMVERLSFMARASNALVSCCRYLGKWVWPVDLSVFYPHPGQWPISVVLGCALLLLGICVVAIRLRQQRPYLFVGWFWFLGTLVPVIGLIQVGIQSMADRYTYLPLIGLLFPLVWGIQDLTRGWRYRSVVLPALSATVLVLYGAWTRKQIEFWKKGETLFRHAVEVTSNNALAHLNLGVVLEKENRLEEVRTEYEEALALNSNSAEARRNLGIVLQKMGHDGKALKQLQEALRLDPNSAQAYNAVGVILGKQGDVAEAINCLERAIALKPDFAEAHFNLAVIEATRGNLGAAISQYEQTLKLRPGDAEAHNFLGGALATQGRLDEAISHFEKAVSLKPDFADALRNLAQARALKSHPLEPVR